MYRTTFVSIFTVFGIGLGNAILYAAGYANIFSATVVSAIFGTIFGLTAEYLNKKGYLVSLFQIVDLCIGFIFFYFIFYFVISIALFQLTDDKDSLVLPASLIPIPLAILMIIRHIKKKGIKLQKQVEED